MSQIGTSVELEPTDRVELTMRARSTSLEHRYVLRARVILCWANGMTLRETSRAVGLSRNACCRWRRRFVACRLEGLKDTRRPGRPRGISPETRARVVETACSKPTGGYSSWTQRRIAKACGVSQTSVCHILGDADLKPHKTHYWCGKPTDPEFEAKMMEIIGLYLNPPEDALVLCVDEKTQMQVLDRRQPVLPMREGTPKRFTNTYTRHGTVSLIAALSVHSGDVTARTIPSNASPNFLAFLKSLYRRYPHQQLHIIADNLSAHKSQEVKTWLGRRRRITMHYTPTYSSWLNQVEIWFHLLARDVLKDGIWTSKQQMVRQMMEYIQTYRRERARPFAWTYTGKPCKA